MPLLIEAGTIMFYIIWVKISILNWSYYTRIWNESIIPVYSLLKEKYSLSLLYTTYPKKFPRYVIKCRKPIFLSLSNFLPLFTPIILFSFFSPYSGGWWRTGTCEENSRRVEREGGLMATVNPWLRPWNDPEAPGCGVEWKGCKGAASPFSDDPLGMRFPLSLNKHRYFNSFPSWCLSYMCRKPSRYPWHLS